MISEGDLLLRKNTGRTDMGYNEEVMIGFMTSRNNMQYSYVPREAVLLVVVNDEFSYHARAVLQNKIVLVPRIDLINPKLFQKI